MDKKNAIELEEYINKRNGWIVQSGPHKGKYYQDIVPKYNNWAGEWAWHYICWCDRRDIHTNMFKYLVDCRILQAYQNKKDKIKKINSHNNI